MKKFLCMTLLTMLCMSLSAMAQVQTYSPPEHDIGMVQKHVATLTVDGQTVISFDQQFNIVDWQTPVTVAQEATTVSAQVVDAYTVATADGTEIGMTLVCLRWSDGADDYLMQTNIRSGNHYRQSDAPRQCTYPFTSAHTDRL